MNTRRPYRSPLREEQTAGTRSRIVDACVGLIRDRRELTFAAVARRAGVRERTVYRHFPTKDALEAAVWRWIVEHLTQAELTASSEDQLVGAMRRSFAGFDAGAGLIEAMLHSPQGLAIRQSQQTARRAMFERCARSAVPGVGEETCTSLAAMLQLLYSATAWDQLRSFWGMDVDAAADLVENAIRLLLAGARQETQRAASHISPANHTTTETPTTEEHDMRNTTSAPRQQARERYGKTRLGEGERYWFYGDLAIVRSPEGAMPIVIEHHVKSGGAAPLHLHQDLDDSFYLLVGQLAIRCGEDTFVAHAGDYVVLPREIPHTLRVTSDEDAVMLQTHADPSFLNFIRAVGVPASEPRRELASMDIPAMNHIAGETGQPVLGPPMSAQEAMVILAG